MKQLTIVCGAIIKDGKLLIAKRNTQQGYGIWEFPGGKVEKDETLQAALIRELQEELGLICEIEQCMGMVHDQQGNLHLHVYGFVCHIKAGSLQLSAHSEAKWVSPQELYAYEFQKSDRVFLDYVQPTSQRLLIDLSQTLKDHAPVYPEDPAMRLEEIAQVEKDGFSDYQLTSGMHVGTHIDAPAHMVRHGKQIDELSLEQLLGPAKVFDVFQQNPIALTTQMQTQIQPNDIVLFFTGHEHAYGSDNYFYDFPCLDATLVAFLRERKVSMIGIDAPSFEPDPYTFHHALFEDEILLIENLCNLYQLLGHKKIYVTALPIKISASGALARVIATLEKE
ncbi:MAG: cyclase family protein [Erysipelotrichaceae bacterium]